MRRREFIALASASAAWPFAAQAQEPGRTYRLGCLLPLTRDAPINVAFFNELRRRGFIEGQNLTVEYRAYGLHPDLISQYAAELVKARVDVIITGGEEVTPALQQATKTIPIVAMSADMLEYGFVNSLARPDGNTTGVSILAIDLDGKRQDILIEAVPGLRRMAALVSDDVTDHVNNTPAKLDALQQAAHAQGVELSIHRVARGEEIAVAIDSAQTSGATALNILASPLFFTHAHLIVERATALRLPAMFFFPEEAEEGGFAAYGPSVSELFLEVQLQQVVKLLRGTKVADIPVEQPTKFELLINLKTAKAMGVTVPPALLLRADKLIE
jgi:putative ABC transport system substrate-binding protein